MKKKSENKKTIEEAAVEILTVLGGKAHRSQIIPYILEQVEFKGDTPEHSISCSLQRAKKIRASEGQRGWWELVSYQEELSKLREENERLKHECEVKDSLIAYMKSDAYCITIISNWTKRYMYVCKKKSQTMREKMKEIIVDFSSKLKFQYDGDVQEIIDHFDDENPPVINVVKKEYKDNATSADIDIPGITPQDIQQLLQYQSQNMIEGNSGKTLIGQ